MRPMAMGKRKRERQSAMWVPATNLPTAASHPFYRRLNQLLREHGFDDFVEAQCASFYAETMGRPGVPPGIYFRLLLIGYFEGIDSERGIAWREADSFALRDFLGVGLEDAPPDHSTISRTRRLIALETHRAVFTWVLRPPLFTLTRTRWSCAMSKVIHFAGNSITTDLAASNTSRASARSVSTPSCRALFAVILTLCALSIPPFVNSRHRGT